VSFLAYPRPDNSFGVRNYVGIFSTVACANDVARWISEQSPGSVAFTHQQGCCQTSPDLDIVTRTLISLGQNPNLSSVLLVSLGCESIALNEVAEGISKSGKEVEQIVIQKLGGSSPAVAKGSRLARQLIIKASQIKRTSVPASELRFGIKCGASDTTSGLISNPATGAAVDLLLDNGGSCIFGETTEFIGAEHILAKRAISLGVSQQLLEIVKRMEERAIAAGTDMRGGQPTGGNIAGGITTIEEKSLGAIVKSGSKPIQAIYEYGCIPKGKGLFIIDSPGREPEALTGLAAAGAHIILFSTGRGAPQGFPFVPVIKITGNPLTYKNLPDHIDLYITLEDISGRSFNKAGKIIYEEALKVASGKKTIAETTGYTGATNIYSIGPVI
jgi:altronate dehydratase large subunit